MSTSVTWIDHRQINCPGPIVRAATTVVHYPAPWASNDFVFSERYWRSSLDRSIRRCIHDFLTRASTIHVFNSSRKCSAWPPHVTCRSPRRTSHQPRGSMAPYHARKSHHFVEVLRIKPRTWNSCLYRKQSNPGPGPSWTYCAHFLFPIWFSSNIPTHQIGP
jgi:hypothetical protein